MKELRFCQPVLRVSHSSRVVIVATIIVFYFPYLSLYIYIYIKTYICIYIYIYIYIAQCQLITIIDLRFQAIKNYLNFSFICPLPPSSDFFLKQNFTHFVFKFTYNTFILMNIPIYKYLYLKLFSVFSFSFLLFFLKIIVKILYMSVHKWRIRI